jgi:hypothetical protein
MPIEDRLDESRIAERAGSVRAGLDLGRWSL